MTSSATCHITRFYKSIHWASYCMHFTSNIMATIAKMKQLPLCEVGDLVSVSAPSMLGFWHDRCWQVFEGIFADDKPSVRIVRFNVHHQLASSMESKQPVELHNCNPETVAWGRDGNCHWMFKWHLYLSRQVWSSCVYTWGKFKIKFT